MVVTINTGDKRRNEGTNMIKYDSNVIQIQFKYDYNYFIFRPMTKQLQINNSEKRIYTICQRDFN